LSHSVNFQAETMAIELNENDVIRGRGFGRRPGSQRWMQLVRNRLEEYIQANGNDRRAIAVSIVLAARDSGIRFLERGDNGDYEVMNDEEATLKTRQCFIYMMYQHRNQTRVRRARESFLNNIIDAHVDELCGKLRNTSTLKKLRVKFGANANFAKLVAALAENNSLKKLSVDLTSYQDDDSRTDSMVSSLCMAISQHPKMTSLTILAPALGDDSSEAIIDLIRFSTTLKQLRVGNTCTVAPHKKQYASKLLKALEENRHLKTLAIPRIGGLTFTDFMSFVLNNPRMKCVTLVGDDDDTAIDNDDIKAAAKLTPRQKPFVWEVGARVATRCRESVCQLLKAHPEILVKTAKTGTQTRNNDLALPPNVQFWADFHRAGRYLLQRPDLPLSAWPRVLELARAKPSVVHELLKGHAFAGRESLVDQPPRKKKKIQQARKRKLDEMSADVDDAMV